MRLLFTLVSSTFLALSSVTATLATPETDAAASGTSSTTTETVIKEKKLKHMLIGYKDRDLLERMIEVKKKINRHSSSRSYAALDRVRVIKVEVDDDDDDDDELASLLADDNVLYVEEDYLVKPMSELVPYGLKLVQASDEMIASSTFTLPVPQQSSEEGSSSSSPCSDKTSLKVAIIDSGVDTSHPDLSCLQNNNCIGATFGLAYDELWNVPTDIHGTHVLGTIAALRNNNVGIQGVMPNPTVGVCFLIARVFGGSVENARLSDILEATEWAAEQGAHVINMSLGGPEYSSTAQNLYELLRLGVQDSGNEETGVLLVAASGNEGTPTHSYPASYTSVLSVGAVNADQQHAAFSQYNELVDVAAPGEGVLSTVPMGLGSITTVSVTGDASGNDVVYSGSIMFGSVEPSETYGISGVLVECPDLGSSTCPGLGGHICLIERGEITFEVKALNCQASGGSAVLIYNNIPGAVVAGTLESPTSVGIPVVGLTLEDGLALLELLEQSTASSLTVSLTSQDGYAYSDGTSFASPHVAGVAAAVWQACGVTACTAEEIQYCLITSAKDLGTTGKDDYFGFGLVQLEGTYTCLVNDVLCCSPPVAGATAPAEPPVQSPTVPETLDCGSSQVAYQSCFIAEMDSSEAARCRACVNERIPFNVFASTCSYLNSEICPAIHEDCTFCQPCVDEIDFYITCAIFDVNGCDLNCSGVTGQTGNPAVDGNIFTNPVPAPGSDTASSVCESALQDMRECFVLNEAVIAPHELRLLDATGGDGACEVCVEDALSLSRPFDCTDVNAKACPAIQQCGCQTCRFEIDRYTACMVDIETNGNCQVACSNAFSSSITSSSSISNHGLRALLVSGLLCVAAWVM